MAKINFYVRSKEKGQPGTVYLRYSEKRNIDFWIPTPEKIFPEHWSIKTGNFKQKILYTDIFTEQKKIEIEGRFSELKQYISEEVSKLKGEILKDWLKIVIAKYYNRSTGDEYLNGYLERFINEITLGKRLNKGKNYTYSTIKNYKGFQSQFNEYQGIYTEKQLTELKEKGETPRPLKRLNFNDITIDFYKDFVMFFNDKSYSPNTIGRHMKHLKVLMRQSMEEGLHNNTEYQRKSFEAMAEKVYNIYLSESEMKKLFDLDLSGNEHLEIIRDVFLCGCYTAQRYSDYSRINRSQIRTLDNDKKVIDLIQQKTGERVTIPVRNELEIILKKYDYTLPKTFEQKVNEKIKIIGAMAKINDDIAFEENRGGLRIKKKEKKNELIKTHTARRSGCTNMYLSGIPILSIMKISGHKTEREFLKYIKITKEETAFNLSSHPYFNQNLLKIV
jgi:integrase